MWRKSMMFYTDNPGRDADWYFAMKEALLERLPKCDSCGEPIQDEFLWEIGGEVYCEECAKDRLRVTNKAI